MLYEFGDANFSMTLTVTDAVAVANEIVGLPNDSWDFKCADINFDGVISIGDATSIISAVMEYNPSSLQSAQAKAPAMTVGQLAVSDFAFDSNGMADASVRYTADRDLIALQVDFVAGDGVTIDEVVLNPAVEATHSLSLAPLRDGGVRAVLFSMGGDVLPSGDEPLMTLKLRGNRSADASVDMRNVFASTPDAREYTLGVSSGSGSTTGVDEIQGATPVVRAENGQVTISGARGQQVQISDITGRVVYAFEAETEAETRALGRGVYIVTVGTHSTKVML